MSRFTSVIQTLIEAFILVFIVVLVFLQNWRATIIPMIAVPVSLIGTFAVMAMLGFSLNNLSLFGLVLAIGIVVDDAIVVVENVERWLADGPVAARASAQGDGRGDRAGDRHCPGALRGVRADGVHGRHQRAVLQAVRADDRRLDDHLGVQLADAQPGPVRAPAQSRMRPRRARPRPARSAAPRWASRSSAACSPTSSCSLRSATLVGIEVGGHGERSRRARQRRQRSGRCTAGVFVVGGVAGWFAGVVINRVLGAFFRGFNWVFDVTINGYGKAGRGSAADQRHRPAGLRRA